MFSSRSGSVASPFARGRARDRRAHAVTVVLDDEDDGEIPQGSQVQRFMERADVDGRLSEEADADLIAATILDCESDAGRDRNVSTDDGVSAQEVRLGIEDVHGAALAARATGGPAEQLRHDRAGAHSASERLPVI